MHISPWQNTITLQISSGVSLKEQAMLCNRCPLRTPLSFSRMQQQLAVMQLLPQMRCIHQQADQEVLPSQHRAIVTGRHKVLTIGFQLRPRNMA